MLCTLLTLRYAEVVGNFRGMSSARPMRSPASTDLPATASSAVPNVKEDRGGILTSAEDPKDMRPMALVRSSWPPYPRREPPRLPLREPENVVLGPLYELRYMSDGCRVQGTTESGTEGNVWQTRGPKKVFSIRTRPQKSTCNQRIALYEARVCIAFGCVHIALMVYICTLTVSEGFWTSWVGGGQSSSSKYVEAPKCFSLGSKNMFLCHDIARCTTQKDASLALAMYL